MPGSSHHCSSGRARIWLDRLYRRPERKADIEMLVLSLPGVDSAQANPLTGRMLLCFDPRLSLEVLLSRLEQALAVFEQAQDAHSAPSSALTMPVARPDPSRPPWQAMSQQAVADALGVEFRIGLSTESARARLARHGPNALNATEVRPDWRILAGQFNSLPVALLGGSALVALGTGAAADALVILAVVAINAGIGFLTERQAERTIASLSQTGVREVRVLRDGTLVQLPVEQIVPGDLLPLEPGDWVPADLRLIKAHRLSIDESPLTGESLPVDKDEDCLLASETALADRRNLTFMGTHVTGGNGRGLVVATGRQTELGRIQQLVGEASAPRTPTQGQLQRLGSRLALLSGAVSLAVFLVGVLRGQAWPGMLKAAISLAVAAVPEGLPAVSTTTLARGVKRLRRDQIAVRHLDAVETLGAVQIFCLDKTGTLTTGGMRATALSLPKTQLTLDPSAPGQLIDETGQPVSPAQHQALRLLLETVALCSETRILQGTEGPTLQGSATENALVELALAASLDVDALRDRLPRLKTRFRAEGRAYMRTLHQEALGTGYRLAVKGSPEAVLAHCDRWLVDAEPQPLTDSQRAQLLDDNHRLADQALRVLAVAYQPLDAPKIPKHGREFIWLGLVGIADALRPGVETFIRDCQAAGIQTLMITGDQPATARAIGQRLGLAGEAPLRMLDSEQLQALPPEALSEQLRGVQVFARVSPADKLRIVRALQADGRVVAMTGDGINDGPALKAADIGVAMGLGGTNVAREVSDVVLEDDRLERMTQAIAQGRGIGDNIAKMIRFMVSTNLSEIELMFVGVLAGWGQVLNPMQLLWINLATDIAPGLALAMEPAEPGVLHRGPRDAQAGALDRGDLGRVTLESAVIGAGTLGAYLYGLGRRGSPALASTLAFHALVFNELAHALNCRSPERHLIGGRPLAANPALGAAIAGTAALQLLVSVIPAARRLLGTTTLTPLDLAVVAASVLGPMVVNDLTKVTSHPARIATVHPETDASGFGPGTMN